MSAVPNHPVTTRPSEWVHTAPLVIQATWVLPASAADVFRHVAAHEDWPRWFTDVVSVEVTGERSGVGGKRRVALRGLVVDEIFTAWEDDRLFAFTVESATRPVLRSLNEQLALEPIDERSCRAVYTQGWDLPPWLAPVFRLLSRPIAGRITKALDNLGALAAG